MTSGSGLRVSLVPDLFDALVWAVVGQQVTFARACTLRRRLYERVGTRLPGGVYAPPPAQTVAALNQSELRAVGLTQARTDLLGRVAALVASGALDLEALAQGPASRAQRCLLAVPGIGPWTAGYVLRGFGFADSVPVGDSALARGLQRLFHLPQRPGPLATAALMAPFAPHRSLATLHLWRHATPETP
ncbi:DNA-3-methyladenine glycosylase family protein [Deinococcus hohokamensis]|uniref:DNA-3-methyladenine glycosylase II n=1 Tax=Deinococcus hohokamensis TaxID=309883 RepID=A0ABV9ID72_9DEIO